MRLLVLLLMIGLGHAGETVYLKSGKFQEGTVLSQDEETLTFEFTKAGGTAKSQVEIPWKAVDRIEFAILPGEQKALQTPATADLALLARLWTASSPWIACPRSRAADIGLLYAEKLVKSGAELSDEQSLEIYRTIAEKAWEPEKQAAAIRGRLTALLTFGREREAIREAEALSAETDNPSHLLEAQQILAAHAFERLKVIEEENPRWQLDEEIRPERNRLFHKAIDHALYAYLFYGTLEYAAARGLFFAAEVYEFSGDLGNSRICAEDIVKLYPDTEFAALAKTHLEQISTNETKE